MAISAASSVPALPQLTAVQARQITQPTPTVTATPPTNVAAYASPVYKFDPLAKLSIELIRNTTNGSVINQIPPQQVVDRYRTGQLTAGNAAPAANQTNAATAAAGNAATGGTTTAAAAAIGAAASTASAGAAVSIRV